MPIKPENKARYPADWRLIRDRIVNRARNQCEFCGVRNGALGGRTRWGRFLPALPVGEKMLRLEWPRPGEYAWCRDGDASVRARIIRVVLTVAHLDHTPENCADENLRALCQRCHLRYDHEHHQQNARLTRRIGKAVADMFSEPSQDYAGMKLT